MTSNCGVRVIYPKKLQNLPKKLKDRVVHEIFKEEKIRVDEVYEKLKSQNTNHCLLFNKPNKLCDSLGRQRIVLPSQQEKVNQEATQPYINFLNSSERQIISWKSKILPSLTQVMTEFTICQQMDMKVEQIIKEFTDFWTELGSNCSEEEKMKNAETMRQMFAIDFDEHLSRALVNIPKELMCVPNQVASANCIPEASVSVIIKRIVDCDIKAEEEDKRTVGFNTALPKDLANIPPKNFTKQRWIDIDAIPPDLLDMSAVWEGITHLKSSYDYFNWLKEDWDKQPPSYLGSYYSSHSDIEPTCDTKDLMELYQISETMLPVLRGEEQNIEDMKKKALENL